MMGRISKDAVRSKIGTALGKLDGLIEIARFDQRGAADEVFDRQRTSDTVFCVPFTLPPLERVAFGLFILTFRGKS